MSKTAELLADEVRSALQDADYFTVSLFHNHTYEVHPLRTLGQARQAAVLLPKVRGSARKAIVYVVTKAGQSVMVPDGF